MLIRCLIAFSLISIHSQLQGEPTETQITHDAADFHTFRVATLAAATEISNKHPKSNQGADYIGVECRKLAHRTSPEYLYGVFRDLSQDTSRTEEPFLIEECLMMAYPPESAKKVLHEIKNRHIYNASEIQALIEDIEGAQQTDEPVPHTELLYAANWKELNRIAYKFGLKIEERGMGIYQFRKDTLVFALTEETDIDTGGATKPLLLSYYVDGHLALIATLDVSHGVEEKNLDKFFRDFVDRIKGITPVKGLNTIWTSSKFSYQPPDGCVPDAKTAFKIAIAVLTPIYGEKEVESNRPFTAVLRKGVWTVGGIGDHPGILGGGMEIDIAKSNARILRIYAGQ